MTVLPRTVGSVNWIGMRTLLRRELRRYVIDAWETIAAPAFSALIYFLVFAFALGDARGTSQGDAVLAFLLPGLVMLSILLRAAETTSFSLLFDKIEGVISDILGAPLSAAELTACYALAGTAAGVVTGGVTYAAALLIWPVAPVHPWMVVLFGGLGSLTLSLFGILIGLWGEKWDHLAAAFAFFLMPLIFLSGLFAPVDLLPPLVAGLVRLNPIFHAIDGFRYGFLGTGDQPPLRSAAVLVGSSAVLWFACNHLIRTGYKLRP
ncbi:ABC transporter permease [Arenibaculum sp.]|uniref:ABC transporter permease n=1 Tax=Arenibaculum sp. TaxID=2865862 RepID=UPI002E11AB9E|nr:ABC transporter permease [Arenibaculum sp.]